MGAEGGGEVEGEGGEGRGVWAAAVARSSRSQGGGGVPSATFGTEFKPHFRYQVSVFKLGVRTGVFWRGEILSIAPPKKDWHTGIQIDEPIAGIQPVISFGISGAVTVTCDSVTVTV